MKACLLELPQKVSSCTRILCKRRIKTPDLLFLLTSHQQSLETHTFFFQQKLDFCEQFFQHLAKLFLDKSFTFKNVLAF